jgi:hypothetical protein
MSNNISGMSERFHGPVPKWHPSPEDLELIGRLQSSADDVDRAYAEAYAAGCFVQELSFGRDTGFAAVGEVDAINIEEFRRGEAIPASTLTMAECMELGMHPGRGKSRAERIRDGIRKVEEARERSESPLL